MATQTDAEKRASKSKRTKAVNKAALENSEEQLRKARATARNAQRALKEYKAGLEAGIKLVTDAMRANT